MKRGVVAYRVAFPGPTRIVTQPDENFTCGVTRSSSSGGHMDNFSVDDFRLARYPVKIFDCGFQVRYHRSTLIFDSSMTLPNSYKSYRALIPSAFIRRYK